MSDQLSDTYDLVSAIIAYESGDMVDEDEFLEFIQQLIDTGLAWKLQGHYGRMAVEAIERGFCTGCYGGEE